MLNPDEKMLKSIRECVRDLNHGHIDLYTFAMVVWKTVEPNLYSSTLTAIACRTLAGTDPVGQPNTGSHPTAAGVSDSGENSGSGGG